MTTDMERLTTNLQIERIDKFLFIGKSPKFPPRVFGGQVLAQSINAAIRTVDEESVAHSMHAYFMRPGNPKKQIVYEVDPIRDGRSFTTRRVVAKQDGVAIFSTAISFQIPEPGLEHQFSPPDVPGPEELEDDFDYWTRMATEDETIDPPLAHSICRRAVNRRDFLNPADDIGEPRQQYWMKTKEHLGDDPILHQTFLAYMSDMTLMGSALRPHPYSSRSREFLGASLDHALWFHRPFRADEWLLFDQDSPIAQGARGFTRGTFYTQSGELVASCAQEALIRISDRT
jgi:acyl-CoA thioesterase II